MVQLSYPYMTTGKTIVLTRRTFVGKVMSLLFNMLTRLVIAFLPRNRHILISRLQSPSAMILEPKKIVSHCFHCFPTYLPWSDGIFVFWMLSFKPQLKNETAMNFSSHSQTLRFCQTNSRATILNNIWRWSGYGDKFKYMCVKPRGIWPRITKRHKHEKIYYSVVCNNGYIYGKKSEVKQNKNSKGKQRGTKQPLDKSERVEWKSWLKTQHSKNEDLGIQSHHFMANRWGNNGNSDRLFSWAPKSPQMMTAAIWN